MKQKSNIRTCLTNFVGGSTSAESKWLRNQLKNFTVKKNPKKKPKFEYRLPFIGGVCRHAWVLAAGFPNPNNSRIRAIEAEIRNPAKSRQKHIYARRNARSALRGMHAIAFIEDYILRNSQRSPASTDL